MKDVFKIFLSDIPTKVTVSLYGETQVKSYTGKVSSGEFANEVRINMSALPADLYIVKVNVNNKLYTLRVVKE